MLPDGNSLPWFAYSVSVSSGIHAVQWKCGPHCTNVKRWWDLLGGHWITEVFMGPLTTFYNRVAAKWDWLTPHFGFLSCHVISPSYMYSYCDSIYHDGKQLGDPCKSWWHAVWTLSLQNCTCNKIVSLTFFFCYNSSKCRTTEGRNFWSMLSRGRGVCVLMLTPEGLGNILVSCFIFVFIKR